MVELQRGDARLVLDPDGGRVVSLHVGELSLLRTPDDDPGGTHWGSFVMAPWAGRTRRGRFTFDGLEHELEINAGVHAIHGTVRNRAWSVDDATPTSAHLTCELGPAWPFAGHAEQTITLLDDRVHLGLSVHAHDGRMPVSAGWHPWWQRNVGGVDARLRLPARSMYVRDEEGIAVAELVPPPPGPWDDCFTDLSGPPVLSWDGVLSLTIDSDCPCVVVYDELAPTICVEPQTAPPDALNGNPSVVEPRRPLAIHTTWSWS